MYPGQPSGPQHDGEGVEEVHRRGWGLQGGPPYAIQLPAGTPLGMGPFGRDGTCRQAGGTTRTGEKRGTQKGDTQKTCKETKQKKYLIPPVPPNGSAVTILVDRLRKQQSWAGGR